MYQTFCIKPWFESNKTLSSLMPYSYYLYGSGLDLSQFEKVLEENNFVRPSGTNDNNFDFVWVETVYSNGNYMYDKNMYKMKAYLKSILDDKKKIITDKDLLYKNMPEDVRSKHMAHTFNISELKQGEVYIIKPVGRDAQSGKDITVIKYTTNQSLSQIKNIIDSLLKFHPKVIINRYINNVLLFKNKKFHFRMYLLVRQQTQTLPFHYSLFNKGKILTAKLPYKDEDYSNKFIHDTHTKSTDDDYIFPTDCESLFNCEKLFEQMHFISSNCANLIRDAKSYPESKYAFEVFGLDFLVDVNNNVYLLELNDKIGYNSVFNVGIHNYQNKRFTKKYSEFSYDFFNWVYKQGIKDIFSEREAFILAPF